MLMTDTRRSYKGINKDKYNEVNREIKRKIRKTKEEWMRTKCEEIEKLKKKHNAFAVHKKIKEVTNTKESYTSMKIINEENKIITDENEIVEQWETYIETLFAIYSPREYDRIGSLKSAPTILKSEHSKNRKAT
ncbi:hypothetical protein HHI36_000945 [Cryptolaemus montrouzieri]|uniref:Uncharacterized protein n=1 Tax=Cryptolaemus montrouzieri TaxID=559131 RepID=A0ABD2P6T7_9CUCU